MTTLTDAEEFGVHLKAGGWRLGLLVARNVKPNGHGGDRRSSSSRNLNDGKVNATTFAEQSKTSASRVLRFLEAWERAADAGHVPHAAELLPGDEVELPDDEKTAWSGFYSSGVTTDTVVRQNKPAMRRNIASDPEYAAAAAEALAEYRPAAAERALAERSTRRREELQAGATDRAMQRGDEPRGWTDTERQRRESFGASVFDVVSTLSRAQSLVRDAAEVVKRDGRGPDEGETVILAIGRLRAVINELEVLVVSGDAAQFDAALADLLEGDSR